MYLNYATLHKHKHTKKTLGRRKATSKESLAKVNVATREICETLGFHKTNCVKSWRRA